MIYTHVLNRPGLGVKSPLDQRAGFGHTRAMFEHCARMAGAAYAALRFI
jgi:hypothetical protein